MRPPPHFKGNYSNFLQSHNKRLVDSLCSQHLSLYRLSDSHQEFPAQMVQIMPQVRCGLYLQHLQIIAEPTEEEKSNGRRKDSDREMASLNMAFGVAATRGGRLFAAKATKSSASVEEEKGPFDWIMGGLLKDQLLETDPVLQKVEDKSSRKPTNSVAIPNKKKFGGFGSLFVKN